MVVAWPLVAASLLVLATTALFVRVARLVLARAVAGEARLALRSFAAWWLSAAAVLFINGAHTFLVLVGVMDLAVHVTVQFLFVAPLAFALAALLYFLGYVYTGNARLARPIAFGAALFFMFNVYVFASVPEWRLVVSAWDAHIEPVAGAASPLFVAYGLAVTVPALLAAMLYGALYFRVQGREQRYRIGLVSSAFVMWFGVFAFAFVAGWHTEAWFPLSYELPGLAAAILVHAAFAPPLRIRPWLSAGKPGVEPA